MALSWSAYVFPLLLIALSGVAIFQHRRTTALSLPLSPALTILTVLLPILSLIGTYGLVLSGAIGTLRRRVTLTANLVNGLQFLQLILATVLATAFFGAATPTDVRRCLLSTTWQRLFASKDADAIRRIQDTFDCCGFNSVRDRAWPFAGPGSDGGAPCAERFGRAQACVAPWTASLQHSAGVDGGVSVTVVVLQVVISLLMRWVLARRQRGATGSGSSWPRLLASIVGLEAGDSAAAAAVARPLLGDREAYTDDEGNGDGDGDGSGAGGSGVNGIDVVNGNSESGGRTPPASGGGHGSTGPRVEPSYNAGHGEHNAWEAD